MDPPISVVPKLCKFLGPTKITRQENTNKNHIALVFVDFSVHHLI